MNSSTRPILGWERLMRKATDELLEKLELCDDIRSFILGLSKKSRRKKISSKGNALVGSSYRVQPDGFCPDEMKALIPSVVASKKELLLL